MLSLFSVEYKIKKKVYLVRERPNIFHLVCKNIIIFIALDKIYDIKLKNMSMLYHCLVFTEYNVHAYVCHLSWLLGSWKGESKVLKVDQIVWIRVLIYTWAKIGFLIFFFGLCVFFNLM